MRVGPLPILLVLLLAGCVGSEEVPETPTRQVETAAATGSETPSSEDAAATQVPADPESEPAPRTPVSTPVAWDGKLATHACVPTAPGGCAFPTSLPDDPDTPLEAPGNVTSVALTLTWTASTPLTAELAMGLSRMTACGDGCREFEPIGDAVWGASPLVLEAEVPPLAPGEQLVLHVGQGNALPDPLIGFARVEQTFHVEGEIVSIA